MIAKDSNIILGIRLKNVINSRLKVIALTNNRMLLNNSIISIRESNPELSSEPTRILIF